MVMIDERGERAGIGFVAELPSPQPPRHGDPLIQNMIKDATVMLAYAFAEATDVSTEKSVRPVQAGTDKASSAAWFRTLPSRPRYYRVNSDRARTHGAKFRLRLGFRSEICSRLAVVP